MLSFSADTGDDREPAEAKSKQDMWKSDDERLQRREMGTVRRIGKLVYVSPRQRGKTAVRLTSVTNGPRMVRS